ncbi:DUF1249 domain-containing protein [Thiosocius teredinicola]|uniref:DUF1249 domain-containing protein n=1 Tax=Thiosocius teredinicola TaxID=1973002 RepID=UPI000990EDF8
MQFSRRTDLHRWLHTPPSVGDLQALCEENYQYLLSLIPQLKRLQGEHCSVRDEHQDLHLTIIEQTRYTTLIRLTYRFTHSDGNLSDPDALLRVYHDARQVEVEDLRQQTLPTDRLYEAPGLLNKWRLNLFVLKWLAFCVRQGHLFVDDVSALREPALGLT